MITVVKKSEARILAEHQGSSFAEYALPFKSVSAGVSEIQGRYPADGWDVDKAIEQIWYVESGEGSVETEKESIGISAGDMIHLSKGQKYRIEGSSLKLVVFSSPPWSAEQHGHAGE